ncbi:hypothetical protein MMC15_008215 [Xylographa vitiligo]|nr:hypothetical protein [Xylographa vitiligo]
MPGTIANCACYTNIYDFDADDDLLTHQNYTCDNLASDYFITVTDVMLWNTWVSTNCTAGLFASLDSNSQRAVCVGDDSTAPTSTSVSTIVSTSAIITASTTLAPTPTGTGPSCTEFYTVKSGDSCSVIETAYSITFGQFYTWNPSTTLSPYSSIPPVPPSYTIHTTLELPRLTPTAVGSNCQDLEVGVAYCVAGPSTTPTPSTTSTAVQRPTTPAAPEQSGIASNCNSFYTVASGDSCAKIENACALLFAQLYQWNPAIGSNCESLWVGYAVCVGVSS